MMEGYYRNQPGDKRKFFQYALSSAKETELWCWKAQNRKIMSSDKYPESKKMMDDLLPQLVNFIKSIR
jgi:four helix bundle protein